MRFDMSYVQFGVMFASDWDSHHIFDIMKRLPWHVSTMAMQAIQIRQSRMDTMDDIYIVLCASLLYCTILERNDKDDAKVPSTKQKELVVKICNSLINTHIVNHVLLLNFDVYFIVAFNFMLLNVGFIWMPVRVFQKSQRRKNYVDTSLQRLFAISIKLHLHAACNLIRENTCFGYKSALYFASHLIVTFSSYNWNVREANFGETLAYSAQEMCFDCRVENWESFDFNHVSVTPNVLKKYLKK